MGYYGGRTGVRSGDRVPSWFVFLRMAIPLFSVLEASSGSNGNGCPLEAGGAPPLPPLLLLIDIHLSFVLL